MTTEVSTRKSKNPLFHKDRPQDRGPGSRRMCVEESQGVGEMEG